MTMSLYAVAQLHAESEGICFGVLVREVITNTRRDMPVQVLYVCYPSILCAVLYMLDELMIVCIVCWQDHKRRDVY